MFYDTDADSPCATIKDLAVKQIDGKAKNGILIYDTAGIIKTSPILYTMESARVQT